MFIFKNAYRVTINNYGDFFFFFFFCVCEYIDYRDHYDKSGSADWNDGNKKALSAIIRRMRTSWTVY